MPDWEGGWIDRDGTTGWIGGDMAKPGSETTVMTQTLYYRDPATNSDKVYVATLTQSANGCTVTFEWGRRGANLQCKNSGLMSPNAARILYNEKLTEKLAKGYRDRLDDAGMTYASSQTLNGSRDGVTSLSEINKIAERIVKEVTMRQFGVAGGMMESASSGGLGGVPGLKFQRAKPAISKPEPEIEIEITSKTGRLIILDD